MPIDVVSMLQAPGVCDLGSFIVPLDLSVLQVFMDIANLLHFGFLLTWFVRGLEHQRFEWIFSW